MADSDAVRPNTVVVDMGKRSKKKIKNLRKGNGALLADVQATISELQEQGALGPNAVPVVVVVERKSSSGKVPKIPKMGEMGKVLGMKW